MVLPLIGWSQHRGMASQESTYGVAPRLASHRNRDYVVPRSLTGAQPGRANVGLTQVATLTGAEPNASPDEGKLR
jgi:hypothetical protein